MTMTRLFLTAIVAVIAMNMLHEGGHALVAKLLGYDINMSMNRVWLQSGSYAPLWHRHAVDLAGPAVTIFLAWVGAGWATKRGNKRAMTGAIMVFVALMMRVLATAVSVGNPNDEVRVSEAWGLGYWTLSGIVIALLGWLMFMVHRKLRLGWKFYGPVWIGASLGFAFIVFGEPYLPKLAL